ncbi:MAG: hypothetical protein OXN21_15060 [Chloroflexota bacterium]|nr:hypothetical protein [Chloroflexota bacterium]
MNPQRIARFLLWGGLAVFMFSVASCGVGCVGAADYAFNNNEESEELAGAMAIGVLLFIISIVMVFVGAIIKAVARRSTE